MAHPAQRRWYPLVFVIASLVLLPLSVLLLSWQSIDTQIWSHLWDTQMPRLLGNTLTLIVGDKYNIKDLLRPATFVPESKRLNVLLREFRRCAIAWMAWNRWSSTFSIRPVGKLAVRCHAWPRRPWIA